MSQKNRKAGNDDIPNELAGEVVDTELRKLIQTNSPEKLLKLKLLFSKWSSQLDDFERLSDQLSCDIGLKINPRFEWTPESSN